MTTNARKWFGTLSLIAVLATLLFSNPNIPSRAIRETPNSTSVPTTAATAAISTPEITHLDMLDAMNGWGVVTFTSSTDTMTQPDYLAQTGDGGNTWTYSPVPGNSLTNLVSVDKLHVRVIDDHANTLWRTDDGGRSWDATTVNVADAADGLLLTFADPLHGWLLTRGEATMSQEPAILYQTADGGASWQRINDAPALGGGGTGDIPVSYHTGMVFENQTSGWMTIANVLSTQLPGLVRTTDGGRTWKVVQLPGQSSGSCDMFGPRLFKPKSLTVIADCPGTSGSQIVLYLTDNDGQTWQITVPDVPIESNQLYFGYQSPIEMISPTFGWGIVANSADPSGATPDDFYQTPDGGKHWTPVSTPPGWALGHYGVDFLDQNTGWYLDSSGDLAFTVDSGKNWTSLKAQLPSTPPVVQSTRFQSIHMLSAHTGWAMAQRYNWTTSTAQTQIVNTQDGGKTWANVTPPVPTSPDNIPAVSAPVWCIRDASHVWIYANNAVWRTDDGGQSWRSTAVNAGDALAMSFLDPAHGWLLGQGSVLYQTADGGASWSEIGTISALSGASIMNMAFEDKITGWIAWSDQQGTDTLSRTHDGGTTWERVDIPLPSGMDVCVFSAFGVFGSRTPTLAATCFPPSPVSNPALFLYHTVDDGQTWRATLASIVEQPASRALRTYLFGPTVAWTFDGDPASPPSAPAYLLYRTLNGGKSWNVIGALPDIIANRYSASPATGIAIPGIDFSFISTQTGWAIDVGGRLHFTNDAGKTWTQLNADITP